MRKPDRFGTGPMVLAMAGILVPLANSTAQAQVDAAPGQPRTWRLEPAIQVRQTLTSNVRLAPEGFKESVTEVTPQVRLVRQSGPVQGSVDYALTGRLYARTSAENAVQHALTAAGRAELVPRWAYLDASARLGRQSGGLAGAALADSALLGDGSTEVATLRLAPSVQGSFANLADYRVELAWDGTRTKNSNADSYGNSASLHLAAPATSRTRLGWVLDLSHRASRYFNGQDSEQDRAVAELIYGFGPELRLGLRHNWEHQSGVEAQGGTGDGWGASLRWAPSPRTAVEMLVDERYFGHSHSVRLQHRTGRSVWSYSETRDVSTSASGGNVLRTMRDQLDSALAGTVSDPLQRASLVESALQRSGIDSNDLAGGGFLTTATSLQRHQNLTVGLDGLRTSVLLTAFRGRTDATNPLLAVLPDLPAGAGARQRGASVSVSHRLAPLTALALDASYRSGHSVNSAVPSESRARTVTATWTQQMAQRTVLSVAVRRSLSSTSGVSNNESALVANLLKRF